jgi:hypothetical protein
LQAHFLQSQGLFESDAKRFRLVQLYTMALILCACHSYIACSTAFAML